MMFDRLLSAALIATVITGLSVVCIAAAQTQSRARGPSPQRGAVIAAQGTLSVMLSMGSPTEAERSRELPGSPPTISLSNCAISRRVSVSTPS